MNDCPICSLPLATVDYEGFEVEHCDQCRGYLVPSASLRCIKHMEQRFEDDMKAEVETEFSGDRRRRIECPHCGRAMRKQSLDLPFLDLRSDVCTTCSLVWFDGGELALAQLGHEACIAHLDIAELRRRTARLNVTPSRKAHFEFRLSSFASTCKRLPDIFGDTATTVLGALLQGFVPHSDDQDSPPHRPA